MPDEEKEADVFDDEKGITAKGCYERCEHRLIMF